MLSEFWLLPARPDLWPAPATVRASGSRLPSSVDSQGISVPLPPKGSHVTSVGCKEMDVFAKSHGYLLPTNIPIGS